MLSQSSYGQVARDTAQSEWNHSSIDPLGASDRLPFHKCRSIDQWQEENKLPAVPVVVPTEPVTSPGSSCLWSPVLPLP